jgi:hypothetical protein
MVCTCQVKTGQWVIAKSEKKNSILGGLEDQKHTIFQSESKKICQRYV